MRISNPKLFAMTALLGLALGLVTKTRHTSAQEESPTPQLAAIDAYIESEMARARIPGLALAIVRGDEVLHVRGFGVADPSGRPVSAHTPFIIGSNSKSFTALAIMQLVEAGQIDLDAPAQRYLPWFRVADAKATAQITVRHLLHHTSGIPTAAGQAFAGDDDNGDRALERHVRALGTMELTQPVGQVYQYSNANYNVLGLLVQEVSGRSYESYLRTHIFAPLEMEDAFASEEEAQQHGLATGYQRWFGFPRPARAPYNRGDLPSGFLIASAQDMAHYLIANLNEGRCGQATVLSPEGMVTLHRPAAEIRSAGKARPAAAYGMGWSVSDFDGNPVVLHSGATDNFRSHMVLLPEQEWGFAILMNVNDAVRSQRLDGLRTGVAHLLLGQQPPPVPPNWPGLLATVALPVILVLEVVGLGRSVATLRRWQRYPERRPGGIAALLRHSGLPWALHLLSALVLLIGLPRVVQLSLRLLTAVQPDLAWTAIAGGVIGLLAALLRTASGLLALRGQTTAKQFIPGAGSRDGEHRQLPA